MLKTARKLVSINTIPPSLSHGGGGVTSYAALMGFVESGYKVEVIVLVGDEDESYDSIRELKEKGVDFHFLDLNTNALENGFFSRIKKKIVPSLQDILPVYKLKKFVREKLDEIQPDVVFAYHWDSLCLIYELKNYKKIGLVGDPIHLPYLFRKEFAGRNSTGLLRIYNKFLNGVSGIQVRSQIKYMVKMTNSCDVGGAFAAHHANDLRAAGAIDCKYICTPVPDVLQTTRLPAKKFKIILLGHLRGIATMSGVELFINDIFPNIDKVIGSDNYEVHVIGGYFDTLPNEFKKKLDHPSIIIRGTVTPADNEFLSADLLVVPTPIKLGIRVRIISALSFGTLIVTHIANTEGIPELKHGNNALVGNSGAQMADEIIKVYQDDVDVKTIRNNARLTYENYFTPNAFARQVEKFLEQKLAEPINK